MSFLETKGWLSASRFLWQKDLENLFWPHAVSIVFLVYKLCDVFDNRLVSYRRRSVLAKGNIRFNGLLWISISRAKTEGLDWWEIEKPINNKKACDLMTGRGMSYDYSDRAHVTTIVTKPTTKSKRWAKIPIVPISIETPQSIHFTSIGQR